MSTIDSSVVSQDTASSSNTDVYEHTRPAQGEEPTHKGKNRLLYCLYCSWSGQNTTNARQHLRSKHDILVEAPARTANRSLQILYDKATVINQTSDLDSHVMKKVLNRNMDKIRQSLVSLVIANSLPFRFIESPQFHAFCQGLNPEAQPSTILSSHSTLRLHIERSWNLHKDTIRKKLQSAISTIHLAVDVWTSPNHKLFLGICAQFVDFQTEKLSKALIGLPSIDSHHAEAQYQALLSVLEDYGIHQKLGAVVGDNAASNDKLCRLLSSGLQEKGISWDTSANRMRCSGHIINLAVQAFLFCDAEVESYIATSANLSALKKLHNIVSHTRGSTSRVSQFKGLAGRMIPLDNSTRWNSWYDMISIGIEKESAIDAYSKAWFDDLKQDYLCPEDWDILRQIRTFLEPFYYATKATEGDQATIDRVLLNMDILVRHFNLSLRDFKSHRLLYQQVERSWAVFDKYYLKTDDSPFYAAAILLHPAQKLGYLTHNWQKKWITPAMQAVKSHWNAFKAQDIPLPVDLSPAAPALDDTNVNRYTQLAYEIQNFPRPPSKDEFEEYMSDPLQSIQGSPLTWWLASQQRIRWPKLSQWAINILSIPAMSAEPERVFSGARRTISWDRMNLSAETIEMHECLKHWIESNLISDVECVDDGDGGRGEIVIDS